MLEEEARTTVLRNVFHSDDTEIEFCENYALWSDLFWETRKQSNYRTKIINILFSQIRVQAAARHRFYDISMAMID